MDRIQCSAWGKMVDKTQYVEAGDIVAITGWIQTTNYQKDGQWVNQWEVNLADVDFIKKANQIGEKRTTPVAPPPPPPPPEPDPSESLPFDLWG